MEHYFTLSDTEFEQQVLSCQLAAQHFTHSAHLRLAYLQIRRDGLELSRRSIPVYLKSYCDAMGAADKFSLSLTLAAVNAVYHFLLKSEAPDFKGFIAEFPQLQNNFKALIEYHYGFDVLSSREAKSRFLISVSRPINSYKGWLVLLHQACVAEPPHMALLYSGIRVLSWHKITSPLQYIYSSDRTPDLVPFDC